MWVKIDDGFTDHPKIEALSDRAFRLHVAGMCFCGRTMSNGFIPTDRVKRLLPKVTKAMVDELVTVVLWLPAEGGYKVKDFLAYNPSKTKVVAEREAAAERKRKWREKNASRNGGGNASRNDAPTRPGPARKGQGRSEEPSAVAPPAVFDGDDPDTALPVEVVELAKARLAQLRSVS